MDGYLIRRVSTCVKYGVDNKETTPFLTELAAFCRSDYADSGAREFYDAFDLYDRNKNGLILGGRLVVDCASGRGDEHKHELRVRGFERGLELE
ncbi:hypothetical protein LR48_Vigan01g097800 [Vigna angularis]|uniref:EF-hand domain-containing protein n=1 Tax=Phaseolus angularis TaxID=3914 RepID=A0A0L9TLE7_PHAAN|nr:hypothetical protein LR48_Vigan01g097800 [Vigna angularis]